MHEVIPLHRQTVRYQLILGLRTDRLYELLQFQCELLIQHSELVVVDGGLGQLERRRRMRLLWLWLRLLLRIDRRRLFRRHQYGVAFVRQEAGNVAGEFLVDGHLGCRNAADFQSYRLGHALGVKRQHARVAVTPTRCTLINDTE